MRKHGAGKPAGPGALAEVLVEGELQRGADDVLDGLRGQIEVAAALVQGLGEPLQVAARSRMTLSSARPTLALRSISTSTACQSSRLPSIFCSTWAAITSPALPRSSRICSVFFAAT